MINMRGGAGPRIRPVPKESTMSTRKPHAAGDGSAAATDAIPLGDLPRQQLVASTNAACAVLRGFESIRRIQQATAHEALAQHRAVAQKLREPCQPMELLAMQAELVRHDLQGAAMYWQQLGAAVIEMQRELLGGIASATVAEAGLQAAQAVAPGLNPFLFTVNGAQHAPAA
jgi:hypothetical protein